MRKTKSLKSIATDTAQKARLLLDRKLAANKLTALIAVKLGGWGRKRVIIAKKIMPKIVKSRDKLILNSPLLGKILSK